MARRSSDRKVQSKLFAEARRRRLAGEPVKVNRSSSGASNEVIVMDIAINFEPMPHDDATGQAISEVLGDGDSERLYEQVHRQPILAIEELKLLTSRYPDCGTLLNWYAIALLAAGRDAEAEAAAHDLVTRFPRYLFAVLTYVNLLLNRNDVAGAEDVLRGRFALTQLVPNRNTFHITEVTSYVCVMAQYQMAKGRPEGARSYLEMLRQIDPGSPRIAQFEQRLAFDSWKQRLSALMGRKH